MNLEVIRTSGWPEVLCYFLACFGISVSITRLSIGSLVRAVCCWRANPDRPNMLCQLVNCPMCTGFWVGLAVSYCWKSPSGNLFIDGASVIAFTLIFYVAAVKMGFHEL